MDHLIKIETTHIKHGKLDADPANNNGGVVFKDLHGAYKSVATASDFGGGNIRV